MRENLFRGRGMAVLMAIVCAGVFACQKPSLAQQNVVEVLFTYGSEKENWITGLTKAFNDAGHKTQSGKTIVVKAVAMGSGECVEAVSRPADMTPADEKAHLVSPASAAYIELGNNRWRGDKANNPGGKELVAADAVKNLVLSPVVIAMWEPQAKALGWPKQPVGWAEVLKLARDPKGWDSLGFPQWGRFKFGHTHPEYSNSGLISVLAEAYAGAGKTRGLTAADLANPKVAATLADIERSVVHYGSSTGFFGKKMVANGPNYLSAAVLYENLVIEYNQKNKKDPNNPTMAFPLVAIYPREGTFWSDHPVGVVEREWVTAEHREAANKYVDFMMHADQQKQAIQFGFRPGDEKIPLDSPLFSAEYGVDPKEPKAIMTVPDGEVMEKVLDLWKQQKKAVRVFLVFDTSGSMNRDQKLVLAKQGAEELIDLLAPRDELALLTFSDTPNWAVPDPLAMTPENKQKAKDRVQSLFGGGETALYKSIKVGFEQAEKLAKPDVITAIVVLTDGEDNKSGEVTLEAVEKLVNYDAERAATRVFTIAYGKDANLKALERVAAAAQAKARAGTTKNIRQTFRDIFVDF